MHPVNPRPMKSPQSDSPTSTTRALTAGALVLAATSALYAQDPAPGEAAVETKPPPPAKTVGSFFKEDFVNAFKNGKLSFNARLRYEYADQQTLDPSNAFTIRPRLGFTTADLYGFQGMLEYETVQIIGNEDNYNQAGLNPGGAGKTVIADPEGSELNQAWLSYSRWDSFARGGRQVIILDNTRFVGDVGWRQNNQTFDALTVQSKTVKDLTLFYSYLWNINRIFGDDHPQGDYDSDSHLFNVAWTSLPYAKLVGYTYLLDFDGPTAAAVQNSSTASVGGYLSGVVDIDKEKKAAVDYRAEFAWQTDYESSNVDYETEYYHLAAGGTYDIFTAGLGYEVLGSDNNQGFRTPLATLHAFNGWADVFLNTPAAGLTDLYLYAGLTLPGNIPFKFVYHKFDADSGSGDFGQEFDFIATRSFGKNWKVLLKYAFYDSDEASPPAQATPSDVQKFWAQLEFNY